MVMIKRLVLFFAWVLAAAAPLFAGPVPPVPCDDFKIIDVREANSAYQSLCPFTLDAAGNMTLDGAAPPGFTCLPLVGETESGARFVIAFIPTAVID